MNQLKKQWFLVCLAVAVTLGYFVPEAGIFFKERIGVRFFIVSVLFLMSLTLDTKEFARGFTKIGRILLALGLGYAVLPAVLWALGTAVFERSNDFYIGILILASVPCTLASCTVYTRLAGGNDAFSLVVTVVSNSLNFLFGPILLRVLLGSSVSLPVSDMMIRLFQIIILPVGLGQLLRIRLHVFADKRKKQISLAGRLIILLIVFVAACSCRKAAAVPGSFDLASLALLTGVLAAARIFMTVVTRFVGPAVGLQTRDTTALLFCGSQKTLPIGIAIVDEFFPAHPLAVFPLLFYHALQLIIDSVVIEIEKRRVRVTHGDR